MPRTTSRRGPRVAALMIPFVVAWTALVVLPPVAFLRWRAERLTSLDDPLVQQEWDRFRSDMRRQSGGTGPVQRKVPRSAEPPEKIWLRDFPGVVVAAWIIFVGGLGTVVGGLLRGAVGGPGYRLREVSDPGSGGP